MKWFYDLVVFFCALPGLLWFRPKRIYEGGKKVRVKGGVLTIVVPKKLPEPKNDEPFAITIG